ncbi:MAG: hypothetical protein ACLTBV_27970 [Enterocloster bolteae]
MAAGEVCVTTSNRNFRAG